MPANDLIHMKLPVQHELPIKEKEKVGRLLEKKIFENRDVLGIRELNLYLKLI